MNLTFIIGSIVAWGMIIFGIIDGALGADLTVAAGLDMFINPAGMAIVMGGTFGCIIASYPITALKQFPKFLKFAILPPKFNPKEYISQIHV